jgi:DNA uptake protein ComE-like DNA-binding protein
MVKMYLEMIGYLTLLDRKFPHKLEVHLPAGRRQIQTHYPSIDVIAVNPRGRKVGELPSKFIGEILVDPDGTGIGTGHFQKSEEGYDHQEKRIRIVHDRHFRRNAIQYIENMYGPGFSIVLFVGHFRDREEEVKKTIGTIAFDHPDPLRKSTIRVTAVALKQIIREVTARMLEPTFRNYSGDESLIYDLLSLLNEYSLLKRPRINLNEADEKVITSLPEVGKILAKRIVEERKRRKRLEGLESLFSIPGIGKQTITAIWHLVCFDNEHKFLKEEEVPEIAYKLPFF